MSFDTYRARMLARGKDVQEATRRISKITASQGIFNSPGKSFVLLNGEEKESIVSDKTNYEIRTFLFHPDTKVNKGDYIVHQEQTYITIDHNLDDIYPQTTSYLCNFNFPIKTEEIKTIVGYTQQGRPIYDVVENVITKPCVFTNKEYGKIDNDSISLLNGNSIVYIQFDEVKENNPKINQSIKYRDYTYKVTDIRYDNVLLFGQEEKGYLELRVQREANSNA